MQITLKEFEIKDLDNQDSYNACIRYHDLHFQSDTLLLPDVFENFRYMCLKIYELYPAKSLLTPRLA